MATSKSKGGGPDIRFDEFIKQIRPQPGSAEQLVLIQGYVGESDKEDQIRIYSDESLSEYIDIPRADILYALADEENPLGGSRLWVKQSANVNYNNAYAQGDMYNDYMQNAYSGTEAFGPGAVTVVNCPGPILTRPQICVRPSQFICPTPASRLIICTIQKTIVCPVTITRSPVACGGPSLVDGCPSALGCTIDRTRVINPGGYAGDYGSGDVYGDYMQNTYDGGTTNPSAAVTSPVICMQQVSQLIACQPSVINICFTRQAWCRLTYDGRRTICRPCFEITPTITRTPQSIACNPGIPGGPIGEVGQPFEFNYGAGDMYGDYMQNTYDGGTGATPAAAATTNIICVQPVSLQYICVSRQFICTIRLTRDGRRTICRPCFEITPTITRTPQSLACNPGIPGGPIGEVGQPFEFNYGAGDVYGDYMQNTYDGGGTGSSPAAAATTNIICVQPVSLQYICVSRQFICTIRLTRDGRRTICRPCFEITPTITRTPQSLACNPGIPGGPIGEVGQPFEFNYGGGDVYGDYMQNTYDGGTANPSAGVTSPVICMQQFSQQIACQPSVINVCFTRQYICRLTNDGRRTICRPCFEITPTITRTPQSIACNPGIPGGPIGGNPVGGGGFYEFDYGGGDVYGDYMQNTYDGGVSDSAAAAITTTAICGATRPNVCIIATSPIICRRTIQATLAVCCRLTFSPAICRTRIPQFCITGPTVCCITRSPACPTPITINCYGGGEFGGG